MRNGVPYTRLKATEVQQQLQAEQGVEVSAKTVQRALTQLVDKGHLSRRALYAHRYQRTYWYAPGETEQELTPHRPSEIARKHRESGSLRAPRPVPTEGTPVSPQYLNTLIPNSNLKTQEQTDRKKPSTEKGLCRPPETVVRSWGPKHQKQVASALQGRPGRWKQAQNALEAVVQRATAKGFGPASPAGSKQQPVPQAESALSAGFLR